MSEDPIDGEMTPPPELHLVPRDTSFEHALDETAPKPEPVHDGDGSEHAPRSAGNGAPSSPSTCGPGQGIRSTACKYLDAARFHVSFHSLRSPQYLVMGVLWAIVGAVKVARAQRRLVVGDRAVLPAVQGRGRRQLARSGGRCTAARKSRAWRGAVLGAEVFAVVAGPGADRRARPVVGVADRRRGGHAAAGPLRAARSTGRSCSRR